MRFDNPWILLLCFLAPLLVWAEKRLQSRSKSTFRFSNIDLVSSLKPSLRIILSENMVYLRALSLIFIIFALARPQMPIEETRIYVEGVDIVLAVDTSTSMRAMDFEIDGKRVDRLEVVKRVVEDFIAKRPDDRIGMVAFAAFAYTVCPLTLDHDWLEKNLERVKIGMVEDGTAIGSAISSSLNRLKDSEAKEKIIILLTDGRNNAGRITPMVAAEAAQALGIKAYTIGAGTRGLAPFPVKNMFGETVLQPVEVEIDEGLLKGIAETTGGEYFRATDTESLQNIYEEIDKLEKTRMEEVGYNRYRELFAMFLIPGICLLLLQILLSNTVLRRIP